MRLFTLLIVMALPVSAQVYSPGKKPINNKPTTNSDNNVNAAPPKKEPKSLYGNEIPFIDPTQETVTLMGHTFNLGDNRLGGQFNAYLADSPNTSEAALEYRETIDAILEAVSPHIRNISKSQKLRDGFALLPRAASYPGDGRICDSLSNAIYTAMLSKGNIANSKQYIANLEKEKQRIIYNAGILSRKSNLTTSRPTSGDGKSSSSKRDSYRVQEMKKRVLEIDALKKSHQAKGEVNGLQAKIQYQALLAQLFLQRRFEHVVIGTRFYALIFPDGDSKMRLKPNSDVSKFFVEGLGVEPTITGLDSLSNEAMRKVSTYVAAFNNHLSHDELHHASKRISEAYAIGEFLPIVQTIPADHRRKVLEYVRDGNALVKAMDVRDYVQAKALMDSLKKQAADFDYTKAQGAIAAYSRVSDGHIRAAKLALLNGDQAKFEQELKNATQAWPTNPKLNAVDEELDRLVATGKVAQEILDDFDRLLSEDNFREIYKRRYEFVPVVKDDITRKDAIEQVVGNITRIDGTIRLAEVSSDNGNNFAAWEALAELRDEFPKDPELLQRLEKLSSKVADFTVALNKAADFEDNDLNPQTGSALAWYMQAKSIYPGSKHAQAGIDRLAERILPEILPTEATGSSPGTTAPDDDPFND